MHKYKDILNLPHPRSERRAPMSIEDRAAQFAPFAALTGYDAVIEESGRLTCQRRELTEGEVARLDACLQKIRDGLSAAPRITATVFRQDRKKEGGAYVQVSGYPRKIDMEEKVILLRDGTQIPIRDIYEISADFER